jgi:hypothetical protein
MLTKTQVKANGDPAQIPTPMIGTEVGGPTSSEVNLFADPHTYDEQRPFFYADCEGFSGGHTPPSVASTRPPLATIWARKMDISWPNKEEFSRQSAVEDLYPRLLFTFSDTICFVTRNIGLDFESSNQLQLRLII